MQGSAQALTPWLALYHSPGIGAAKFQAYLQVDPTLSNVVSDFKPDWRGVDRDLAWLDQNSNARIITLADKSYPQILKNIACPPPILYVQGDYSCLATPQIAMVGSRTPSAIGLQQAEYFARHFANLGFIVTSGLALGIDGASHRGALSAIGGKSVAVLAHGMGTIYPSTHNNLALKLVDNGCLVSEFPIGTQPLANHFPRRNRIISGLSIGVLVVEAALNSGSLITAKCAVDQGREVFAIPGSIHNPKVKGCHQLIRQGAKLVESPEDVLEEVSALLNYVIRDKNATAVTMDPRKAALSEQQGRLLQAIDYEATCVDAIVGRTGLAVSAVAANLLNI